MSSPRRRIETDVRCAARESTAPVAWTDICRLMSDYEVTLVNDNSKSSTFASRAPPRVTPFEGGVWKVHVELPDQYPYKSPSIGFVNRIFHPNIDEL
ncbi:ubiquitin-conjugating enzyme [Colletotrichum chrysophilum]|uniref:Ubiquitin-conjugating enzyme n=1 Tax=Colletotrichum chrysophilum TaxID=1836956 RepID=A0AAD9A9S1_9PEZI|nr:ubiquitin-conjugating enzyme [Colletotrichum chrysophilum]